MLVDCLNRYNKVNTIIVLSLYSHWDKIQEQMNDIGWRDNLIIAKKNLKEIISFEFARFAKNISSEHYYPTLFNIELSGICNCRCMYCVFHGVQNIKGQKKGLISWDTLKRLLSK